MSLAPMISVRARRLSTANWRATVLSRVGSRPGRLAGVTTSGQPPGAGGRPRSSLPLGDCREGASDSPRLFLGLTTGREAEGGHGGSGAGGGRYPPEVVVLRRVTGCGSLAEGQDEDGGAEHATDLAAAVDHGTARGAAEWLRVRTSPGVVMRIISSALRSRGGRRRRG